MDVKLYRWSYLFLAFIDCGFSFEDGTTTTMEKTLPAYALATKASLLNETQCHVELDDFRIGVDMRKLWALKTLDSSGEAKPGFIYGNNYWLGSRSQCEDLSNRNSFVLQENIVRNNSKYRNPQDEYPPFRLNYFVVHFRHNSTIQYHVRLPNEDLVTLGLCLPESCSTSELSLILEHLFAERTLIVGKLYSADFKLLEVRDLKNDHSWLMNGKFMCISIFLILLLIIAIFGTIYDVVVHHKHRSKEKTITSSNELKQSWLGKTIMCFSLYTNTKILFNTKLSTDSIPAIHGLRVLGMAYIIMIHTMFYMSDYADNKAMAWRITDGFAVQILSNSTLAVDTFFFLSGFLVAHLYLKNRKNAETEEKPINYKSKISEFGLIVFRRFVRLTPTYMIVIGILVLNSTWYGKTSQFYMSERPQDTCAKYWWRNLLYINNIFGRETMCMTWSWYIANDMQFFIIAAFSLILSTIFFYTAVGILVFLLIASIAVTGVIAYQNEYVPTLDAQYDTLDLLYDPPWTRIGPYIIGVATAYILMKIDYKLNWKSYFIWLAWCLGSLCNILVLFGLWERRLSTLSSAFYVAMSRNVWAIGIAWILIACCTQHGGIVNKALKFRGWVPLSRLTYCAYLLNPMLINSLYLNVETSAHVDIISNGTYFLGNLATTYFSAYVLSLLTETPCILLMRMVFASRDRQS